MRRLLGLLVLAAVALTAGACSTYYPYHSYRPSPAVAQVTRGGVPEARALASVVGVRYADEKAGQPALVDVRLRVENLGPGEVVVDLRETLLVTADLHALAGRVESGPAGPLVTLPAGSSDTWDLVFPLRAGASAGDYDLDGLNLRVQLSRDGEPFLVALDFERWWPDYHHSWYYHRTYDPWFHWYRAYPYPYYRVRPHRHRR